MFTIKKKKFEYFKEKLIGFFKKYEILYITVFSFWAILWIFRAKIIFRKIKHKPKNSNFTIIIPAIRTIPTTNLVYFDAIFGHAFQKLGCQVKMIYCDGFLNSCDADTVSRNQKSQCFLCKKFGRFVKKTLGLDCFSFNQYILQSEVGKIKNKVERLKKEEFFNYKYLGVNVGAHARASTVRFFLSGKINLDNPQEEIIFRKKLVYAMIMTKIAQEVYFKEKPKLIFTLHGIYSTWGPFFDYFQNKNIDGVVYSCSAIRFGRFLFSRNGMEWDFTNNKSWEDFKKNPLSQKEKLHIDSFLKNRFQGGVADQLMYEKKFNNFSKDKMLRLLSDKKYKRRYVLYSNLAWDACLGGRESSVFNDIFSWIDETIIFFKKKPDYQLIIKPHPAELIWEKGTKGIINYIIANHPDLPKNIIVLKSNVSLRAYDLITPKTICLVFNGTIGLEMASQGVPVLTVGGIHYKDAGIVYKINTLEKYLSLLDNPQKIILFAIANKEMAKKYAYFYIFKQLIRIPFYREDKWSAIDWIAMANIKDLLYTDSDLIKICKKIIQGKDIINPL